MKTRYLGVDLHRNCFTVYTRAEDGSGESQEWSIHNLKAFAKTVKGKDEVAVEATGNVRFFCAALKDRGCRVVVVNPHQFQVISRSVKKTDEHDAKILAEFLSKGMLPEVRMKDEVHARVASLAQTRDKLVKLRTTLKNKVNNLLSGRGILIGKESLSSEKGLDDVLASPVSELERMELEILVGEIRHLNESIKKLEGLLRDQGPHLPGWENLTSIKGIGDTGASILLSTIGNIAGFCRRGQAGCVLRHRAPCEQLQRNGTQRPDHQTGLQTRTYSPGAVRSYRRTIQPLPAEVLPEDRRRQRHG